MKRLTFLCIVMLLFVASVSNPVYGNTYFVVIGSFRNETNAGHFTEVARAHHVDASYALNKVKQVYYVFVLHTDDEGTATREAARLRAHTEYTSAWVYHGVLGAEQVHDGVEIKIPPSIPAVAAVTAIATRDTTTAKNNVATAPAPAAAEVLTAGLASSPDAIAKMFMFKVYTQDKSQKEGSIDVIDVDRQKKVDVLKANEHVIIKVINNSGDLRFDCQVAGYRRATQTLNFKNPSASAESGVTIEGNAIVVPFELTRLKEGDKEVLYNIYFYKDAAIMRPESKYELDHLLAMMTENDKYRIKIHGHTNGNDSGKIIEMGASKNFFSTDGSKESYGSAKQLSEERAVLIKDYLTSEGIAATRIETKAWGGKKPIYPPDHPQAIANVRVEVEILAH